MTALARQTTALPPLAAPSATTAEIALGGFACALDLSGALYMPHEDTLVVADLHLEKGSSLARRGSLLPPYDTRTTLLALGGVIGRYNPRRVVALGDSFHDVGGPERLGDGDAEMLAALQAGREWVWIVGNHDPSLPEALPGDVVAELAMGDLVLRHAPEIGARLRTGGPPASGRQGGAPRRRRAPALLRHRRPALRHAGLRRLCGRAQRVRPGLPAALPERIFSACDRRRAPVRHRPFAALRRLVLDGHQSRRKTTLASQPNNRAIPAVAAP